MDRPLPTLLSHVLVAFTIEFDNEAEHRMPHRTTDYGVTRHNSTADSLHTPWLVSMVMYTNCMRFVGADGVTVRELEEFARTKTNLNGMERWGYITVTPVPRDNRPRTPRSNWVIRATPAGQMAREIWQPLAGVIEERWQERFGKDEIEQLRESLSTVAGQIDVALPDCLPILGYGLFSRAPEFERDASKSKTQNEAKSSGRKRPPHARLPLTALLSRVLLAFAIDFETDFNVSLAICANVLRLAGEEAIRVRDIPRLAGVSKEAIAVALSFLEKRGYAAVEPESPGSRVKVLALTAKGHRARSTYQELLGSIEERWEKRFSKETILTLRRLLAQLAGESPAQRSSLFRGLEPYPDGWRASIPKPEILPHFPMVLHRGGFPDGS